MANIKGHISLSWDSEQSKRSISEEPQVVGGRERMESVVPECPGCGGKMIFYSSDAYSQHYICPDCERFLGIPRPIDFFRK